DVRALLDRGVVKEDPGVGVVEVGAGVERVLDGYEAEVDDLVIDLHRLPVVVDPVSEAVLGAGERGEVCRAGAGAEAHARALAEEVAEPIVGPHPPAPVDLARVSLLVASEAGITLTPVGLEHVFRSRRWRCRARRPQPAHGRGPWSS